MKLLLNVSKDEQRKRFLERIDMPEKNWKFSAHDVHERGYWDDYQRAFSEMLSATSTPWAPWHVIPADHKWFARAAAAAVIIEALKDIDPRYPKLDPAALSELAQAKAELEAEDGGSAAAPASADGHRKRAGGPAQGRPARPRLRRSRAERLRRAALAVGL